MVLIVLLSFYSLINVPYLYLPEGARINFGDYLIGELNMIQLIMFIAYPSIFSFLVLNIIRGDFEDNYIQLIFPRTTSRFIYLLNKFIIIIFVALCFTMTVVLSKLVISFVLKITSVQNSAIKIKNILITNLFICFIIDSMFFYY